MAGHAPRAASACVQAGATVMSGPLQGVTIVDITTVLMGPYATQLLGDMGADVIKIEPPGGDPVRGIGPARHAGMGCMFLNTNRNKRSIVVDLKQAAGRDVVLKLAGNADVLIYNVRPQAMARLKLSYDDVRAVNPRIIYAGLYGFGQGGPYAAKAAYDDLIQGGVGIPSLTVQAGATAPRYMPGAMADRIVGMSGVNAVLAALYQRERSGQGQSVEVPMFETMAQFVLSDHLSGYTFEAPIGPPGYQRLLSKNRRPFATQDGYLCVLVYSDDQWKRFFSLIGKPELALNARYTSIRTRTEHIDELYALLASAMQTRSTADWLDAFEENDIPVMPMHDMKSLIEDPHLQAVGFFGQMQHPSEGLLRSIRTPTHWSCAPLDEPSPAPLLGEHTRQILAQQGYDAESIDRLLSSGAVA